MGFTQASLAALPDEVLLEILYYLPPESAAFLKLTSKRFTAIVEEDLLWRYHCRNHFRYWSPKHNFAAKLAGPANAVKWKRLFLDRKAAHKNLSKKLDDVLSTQYKRIEKIEDIVDAGIDAKEPLLEQYHCPDDIEDVLARRFYSEAILSSIYRKQAIEIWRRVQHNEDVSLEEGLAGFDLFIIGTRDGDVDDISEMLDRLAAQAREENPELEALTPREQALAIVRFVRKHDLTGIRSMDDYHNIKHTFLGIALQDPEHQSLPLISVAIFCCIAQRLGINAHPCGFPLHVYGVILPPGSKTLDGDTVVSDPEESTDLMYVDPFRSDFEVPPQNLVSMLRHMGMSSDHFHEFLGPASVKEMILRTARNLTTAIDTQDQSIQFPDTEDAFYAMVWALILMTSASGPATAHLNFRRRQFIPHLNRQFEAHFPWDTSLIEQYILPMSLNVDAEGQQLLTTVESIRGRDSQRMQHPRQGPVSSDSGLSSEFAQDPRYFVGQMLQHKRYGYEGLIIGWDRKCEMSEEWITQMGVNRLSQGRKQSFYHVM